MGNLVKLPLPGKSHERIEFIAVQVYPVHEGVSDVVECRMCVQTNRNEYSRVDQIPRNILLSHFDMVIKRATDTIKAALMEEPQND